MNKNRNKVAAMMMVAAITVSSIAMPVEAAVKNVNEVEIQRENRVVEQTGEVILNESNFPDKELRNYFIWRYQLEENKPIPEDVLNITELHVGTTHRGNSFIKDLTGLKYFKNLTYLNCRRNMIKNIDLTELPNLKRLECDGNFIENLNIEPCENLKHLDCSDNMIEELNLSKSTKLETLNCSENEIKNINLKENKSLKELNLSDNKITNIDLSNNTLLKVLEICNSEISSIDLSKNVQLEELDLSNNRRYEETGLNKGNFEEIDLSNNEALRKLNLSNNKIKHINLKNKNNLVSLGLSDNKIEKIDLSECINLKGLGIRNNKLRNLDLTKINAFYEEGSGVSIEGNEIGKLDVNEFKREESFNQEIHLNVGSNKFIDLNKEFGITEKDIESEKIEVKEDKNVKINGTRLEWIGETPNSIRYLYKCGGRNNQVFLNVYLELYSDNQGGEEPDPSPNPDQGGSGGGTTTPDHKPESKPEKPSKPVELRGKIVGKNRYETAAKIADQMGSYNTVILVNSDKSMADGLSAASLSGKKNAPILLVKKNSIPSETMARLEKAENVYIIGGNNVISKKVENQLKGKKITRISGKDRYDTSAKIANLLGDYDTAFIVNGAKGEADAMSVSSVAAKYGAPILLTNGKTSKHLKKANVRYFVIGGKAVVSRALEDRYDADRISGVDRYSTNRKIIDEFYYDSKKVYFAKGDTLVDALAVSALAKEDGVVLVSKKANHKKLEGKKAIQVGGMDFEIDCE